jgi:hypothetical protein
VGEHLGANNTGGAKEKVTIREAATLLGVHPNTVRNRVKAGIYPAEKIHTERGETWVLNRDSLTTNTPASNSQQLVGRVPQEALQILAREIVKEAGLQRDPAQEAWVEGQKLVHETARTQALITAGLLGASAAAGFIPNPEHLGLLGIAFASAILSLSGALLVMQSAANDVLFREGRTPTRVWRLANYGSTGAFAVGTTLLIVFVALNL